MNTPQPNIKEILNDTVNTICPHIYDFAENPAADFTRSRKLPAETLLQFRLDMEGNSLNAEIYNNFLDISGRMTASAFEQQRDKLNLEAFKAILHDFNTPRNKDSEWYIARHYIKKDGTEGKGTCLLHGNFLYDLLIEHCNGYGGYYVIRNPISNTIKEINALP